MPGDSSQPRGMWVPDYSVEQPEVHQHFRYEHPLLAALFECGILLALLFCLAVITRGLSRHFNAKAHRNR
jgi:hypothetical protein